MSPLINLAYIIFFFANEMLPDKNATEICNNMEYNAYSAGIKHIHKLNLEINAIFHLLKRHSHRNTGDKP